MLLPVESVQQIGVQSADQFSNVANEPKNRLEYPLQERLIDSRGKSPIYEEFKEKMKAESLRKPIKDLERED